MAESNVSVIPRSVARKLAPDMRDELAKLPAETQEEFAEEYGRRSKSIPLAFLLCLLVGLHFAYLGSWRSLILFWLNLSFVAWFIVLQMNYLDLGRTHDEVMWALILPLTLGGLWWWVSFIWVPIEVTDYNENIAAGLLRRLREKSQFAQDDGPLRAASSMQLRRPNFLPGTGP